MPGESQLWETDQKTLQLMFNLNVNSGLYAGACRGSGDASIQGSGAIVNIAARAAFDQPAGTCRLCGIEICRPGAV